MIVPLTTYSYIQPPMTMSSDNNVEIQPNDVLSGRGNATKKHLGNIHFRNLVQTAKDYYVAFPCNKKLLISQAVYDAVKSLHPPGRYLKEKDGGNGGILWEEISEKEALTKTSQALREGQSSHKRSGKCPMKIRDQHELDQRLNEIKAKLAEKTIQKNGGLMTGPMTLSSNSLSNTGLHKSSFPLEVNRFTSYPEKHRNVSIALPETVQTIDPQTQMHMEDSCLLEFFLCSSDGSGNRLMLSCKSLDFDPVFDIQQIESVQTCGRYKRDLSSGSDSLGKLFKVPRYTSGTEGEIWSTGCKENSQWSLNTNILDSMDDEAIRFVERTFSILSMTQ